MAQLAPLATVNIFVTGARSQIGHFLLPLLLQHGHQIFALSRHAQNKSSAIHWVRGDLNDVPAGIWEQVGAVDVWMHLAFLDLAMPHLEMAASAGVKRVVCFSSTSVFTKLQSESSTEQQTIGRLLCAEERLESACPTLGLAWTLLRPTMIYGAGLDRNVALIQRVIARFGFFPLAGRAPGLRQPVHAADLAGACIALLGVACTKNRAYNLGGGEVLSYRDMVLRVFSALGRPAHIVTIAPSLYKFIIAGLSRLSPRLSFLQPTMVDRMAMDMVFDHAAAVRDFGYQPQPSQP